MSLIRCENLSFAYEKPILKDLNVGFEANAFWAVVGPNGAGKSTLLRLLTDRLRPCGGSVQFEGRPVSSFSARRLAQSMALVSQEFVPVFGFSVFETVLMGRYFRSGNLLFESEADRLAAQRALMATDTLQFADRPLMRLSGGERQRVFIARALAQETRVLLLDEPTSHLDLRHQVQIFDLLKQMQFEQGKTIVLITHDLNLAAQYCDHVLMLGAEGRYLCGPAADVLHAESIRDFFSVQGVQVTEGPNRLFLPVGRLGRNAVRTQ